MKVYASRSIYFCQPGYKGDSLRKNSSLCMGIAVLCGMKQSAKKKPTMPFGRKCIRAQGGGWVLLIFPGQRSLSRVGPPKKRVTVLLPLPSWLSLKFWTLLMSLRHLQHQKQFLSILAGRQSCIPPNQCAQQGKHPHQPLSLDQEEDLEYLPIPPQSPVHPVCLKLCHHQHLLLPHGH